MAAALDFGTDMHLWTEWIELGDEPRPSLALAYESSASGEDEGATSMTMAEWSPPGISTTRKSTTSSPETKPWSIRRSRGDQASGPQVGLGLVPIASARATAASVNWALILVDVALALELDGVHLGFDAMPVADARRLLGPDALIGVSCHAPDEVKAAREAGADYVHLAPLHDPLSKPSGRPALGVKALEVAARDGLPVIAQGGLEAANAAQAVGAGAAGIAVTGAVLAAADPAAAASELRETLDAAQ